LLPYITYCEPTTHRRAFPDSASWSFALAGLTGHR
jgi:hypothetical protein